MIDLEALEVTSSSEESSCEGSDMESDEEKTFAPRCMRHVLSTSDGCCFCSAQGVEGGAFQRWRGWKNHPILCHVAEL